MSDDGTTDNAQQQAPATPPAFEPITSQEQLNALLGDRLARERAEFGDYNDLKAKASRFDQIEAANKSNLDKATDAASQDIRRQPGATPRQPAGGLDRRGALVPRGPLARPPFREPRPSPRELSPDLIRKPLPTTACPGLRTTPPVGVFHCPQ